MLVSQNPFSLTSKILVCNHLNLVVLHSSLLICAFGSWNPVRRIASKSRVIKAIDSNWIATVLHLEQKASGGQRDEATAANSLLQKKYLLSSLYIF